MGPNNSCIPLTSVECDSTIACAGSTQKRIVEYTPKPYEDPPSEQEPELSFGVQEATFSFNVNKPRLKLEESPKPVKKESLDDHITGTHHLNHKPNPAGNSTKCL